MAPTSSPRVGWTATMSFGAESISRARIRRCRLPPGQDADGHVQGRGGDAVLALEPLGAGPRRTVVEERSARDRGVAEPAKDQVVHERQVWRTPDPGPVLRDVGHAGRDGRAGRTTGDVPAVDHDPSSAGPEPTDDLGQLRLAVARDGRDTHDLAGPHLEGRIAQGRQPAVVERRDTLDRQDDPTGFDRLALEGLEDGATNHEPGQVRAGHATGVDAGRADPTRGASR